MAVYILEKIFTKEKSNMKKLLKTIICTALMVCMLIPSATVNVSAAKPKLSRTSADVPIGYSVTVKVKDASNVKWSSSDESVAAVKAEGTSAKITGKKTGTATVSAKVGNTTLKCAVTVKKSFITTSPEKVTVSKGKSKTVTIKVSGSKDIAVSNSNKDVCSTSWGKWDGNSIKLTIKGKADGDAVIKVYTKKYLKSTAAEISVKVGKGGNDSDGEIIGDDDIKETADTEGSLENDVIVLVNKERKAAGKEALQSDDVLNEAAAIRAKEIAEEFSHTRPDGSKSSSVLGDYDYSYMIVGENIAYTYSDSTDEVMKMWMNSTGHKANILNDKMTKIGVGVYKSGGRYYWVQIFVG